MSPMQILPGNVNERRPIWVRPEFLSSSPRRKGGARATVFTDRRGRWFRKKNGEQIITLAGGIRPWTQPPAEWTIIRGTTSWDASMSSPDFPDYGIDGYFVWHIVNKVLIAFEKDAGPWAIPNGMTMLELGRWYQERRNVLVYRWIDRLNESQTVAA